MEKGFEQLNDRTWWRLATDSHGRTVLERLRSEIEQSEYRYSVPILTQSLDQKFRRLRSEYYQNRKRRIRSIIRRLQRCVLCHGTGKVPEVAEDPSLDMAIIILCKCPICGGGGTIHTDSRKKPANQDKK